MNGTDHQQISSTIEALFAEAVGKQKATSEANAIEAIAKAKAGAEEAITEHMQLEGQLRHQTEALAAENERFQQEIAKRKQAEDYLRERCEQLEQRIEEQTAELTAANQKLQQGIAEHSQVSEIPEQQSDELAIVNQQLENQIEEQTAELAATNKRLEQETAARRQAQESLELQTKELTEANEQLQQKMAEREAKAYDAMTNAQAKLKDAIARQETRTETEAEEIIAKVEEAIEQKAKAEVDAKETIAKVKAQSEQQAQAYSQSIADFKSSLEEAIDKIKEEADQRTQVYASFREKLARTTRHIEAECNVGSKTHTETPPRGREHLEETSVRNPSITTAVTKNGSRPVLWPQPKASGVSFSNTNQFQQQVPIRIKNEPNRHHKPAAKDDDSLLCLIPVTAVMIAMVILSVVLMAWN